MTKPTSHDDTRTSLTLDDGGPADARALPVVLIPSAAGHAAHFAAQLAHLRRTRRALAAEVGGPSWTVEEVARALLAALDRAGVARFVVVGHSWGGAVAIAVVGLAPARVAGLYLLDPASDGRLLPPDLVAGLLAALRGDRYAVVVRDHWASLLAGARSDVRARLMAEIDAAPPAAVIGTLESLLVFDPVAMLARYAGPRRALVTAHNDRPDALHRLAPDLPAESLAGVGHWLHLDAPDQVNARLDAFLAAVTDA